MVTEVVMTVWIRLVQGSEKVYVSSSFMDTFSTVTFSVYVYRFRSFMGRVQ